MWASHILLINRSQNEVVYYLPQKLHIMSRYSKHSVRTKSGQELSPHAIAELQDKAKFMYLKERLSLRRIAAQLQVSAQTIGNWKKRFGWDKLAQRAEKAKENILLKDLTGQVKTSDLVDKQYVIAGLRNIAENGVTESNRVAAFKALGESLGMFDTKGKPVEQDAPLIIEPPRDEGDEGKEVPTPPPSVGSS